MTTPVNHRQSETEFKSFLKDANDRMGRIMESDDMTYAAVEGVLHVFRRRLTPPQVIAFGDALPAALRAMLVYGWRVDAVPLPFGTRAEMIREAQSLRARQNITPMNVIEATAYALWRHVDPCDLSRVLAAIGSNAEAFWHVPGVSTQDLDQQAL